MGKGHAITRGLGETQIGQAGGQHDKAGGKRRDGFVGHGRTLLIGPATTCCRSARSSKQVRVVTCATSLWIRNRVSPRGPPIWKRRPSRSAFGNASRPRRLDAR